MTIFVHMTLPEWQARGRELFGHSVTELWRFTCPACGHVQRLKDFMDLGIPHPELYAGYSCIGRFRLNRPELADSVVAAGETDRGQGCTYSGDQGLAPVALELAPEQTRLTFEFAL